jgi:DNA-binding MarR family transcriptional regulator
MPRADADAILHELGRLSRHLARLVGTEELPLLTASQRIAIIELGLAGPMRVNDLARRMGVSTPTASRTVDALEGYGLATRGSDPDDRRALRVGLSDAGRRVFDDRMGRASEAFGPAAAALTRAERATLVDLLARMAGALDR